MRVFLFLLALLVGALPLRAQDVLVPMDEGQTDHLKAYGAMYWYLAQGHDADWLLNYRGGSFLMTEVPGLLDELRIRGVAFESVSAGAAAQIVAEVEAEGSNTSLVRLETAPKVAVYAPDQSLPWDDAVTLVLTYAEVPYDMIYDAEVLDGELAEYDWLHLHHEDFTGQYGKFFAAYRNAPWYREQQRRAEADARERGFAKVSDLKLAV
ncbi:MAG: asparagine synthetase B, partial [Bacteroidota bacterium]